MTSDEKIIEKEGVIVLLDRLGTKGIWKNNNAIQIIKDWKTVMHSFDEFVKSLKTPYNYKFTTFSDTVIITATGPDINKLLIDVGITAGSLLIGGMAAKIFLRGGVTVGKFFDPDQIIMGPAVDELAQYYTLPEWIGISAAPNAHRILDKMEQNYPHLEKVFCRYDIPLKNSIEHKGRALNWAPVTESRVSHFTKVFGYGKICNSVMEIIDDQLEKASDINISFKWRNTKNFVQDTLRK